MCTMIIVTSTDTLQSLLHYACSHKASGQCQLNTTIYSIVKTGEANAQYHYFAACLHAISVDVVAKM